MPKDIIDLPLQGRMASVRAGYVDEAARTVEIIWTTGATVRRARFWDEAVDEELSLDGSAVRLDRLNCGAPFLNSHDAWPLDAVLSVVVDGSARIANGQRTATIRFSERADVEPIFRDIAGGIIRNVSVGYRVHRYDITKRDDAPELWRAVDWEPLEISAVAIGADPGARVRSDATRTATMNTCTLTRTTNATLEAPMPDDIQPAAAPTPVMRAIDHVQPPAPVIAPAAPNVDAIRAEAQRAAADILTLCQRHGLDTTFAADLIGRGVSLDSARGAVLDKLAEADTLSTRTGATVPAAACDSGASEIAYRDAVTDALMHRHSPGLHKLTEAAREFRGLNLLDMARHALERRGISTRGLSRMELATEALQKRAGPGYHSSADFPFILANVANKTLRSAYDSTPRTFTAWTRQATITDFRPVQRTQLAGAPDLLRVPESGEFTYGTMGEGREVYALLTYGRIIGITRQTLINDDLDAFTRIPSAFGASAADLESDLVYSILTSNPLMGDGVALFNASHGNLGTAGAISETTLAEPYRLFGNQRGLEARQISVQPRYLITPPGSRSVEARKNVTATTPNAVAGVNAFAGRLEPIKEPRLIPAAGDDPWFLAADPNRIDTVEYDAPTDCTLSLRPSGCGLGPGLVTQLWYPSGWHR